MDKERFGHWYREKIVEEMAEKFGATSHIFIAEFQRLKVNDLGELRKNLNKHSAVFMVVKNSLAQLAFKKNRLEGLLPLISGQSGVVLGGDDPVAVAKILVEYNKNFPDFKIKGGLLNSQIISSERIRELSHLPSRRILLGKFSGNLKGIFARFVYSLNLHTKLWLILKGIQEKKGGMKDGRDKIV
ncbi:MAG: 50S ribosomal protein L10 [Candidatus Omnitrophica bacterium]|nr:50S ribosomal protein L10 [Candidatus Omnitrophota bacterium]MCM8793592.1 50S ribosomal protein L10 [Candidatus Omnitrophota bacterium]